MSKKLNQLIEACKARNVKLTESRQKVLKLLVNAKAAKSAYQLLDDYRELHPKAEAMTIYRALDYFIKHHIVHKIPSQNTYHLCTEDSDHALTPILVCDDCHQVTEVPYKALENIISDLANVYHFKITEPTTEIKGLCQDCQK